MDQKITVMKLVSCILLLVMSTFCVGQQNPSSPLQGLENLIGGKWVSRGKWANGSEYHQEIRHEWALSKKLITVKTYDFIDSKQFDESMRNYGVRAWDEQKMQLVFHEFNVFGGIVSGTITTNGKDIFYSYEYIINGKPEIVTDAWIYKDDNTYDFKIGIYKNGNWEKVFMSSVFERVL